MLCCWSFWHAWVLTAVLHSANWSLSRVQSWLLPMQVDEMRIIEQMEKITTGGDGYLHPLPGASASHRHPAMTICLWMHEGMPVAMPHTSGPLLLTCRCSQPGGQRASGLLGWTWWSKATSWWCRKWSR